MFAAVAIAALAVCVPAPSADAQRSAASADDVKAAFVYQFTNYVTWPAETFAEASAPFTIGIVGNNDMAALLRESTSDKNVGGRPILIRELTSPDEATACQIVFIDRDEDKNADAYLAAVDGKPVLTVSDNDKFTEKGGVVRLFEEQNKLRIEINVDESDRSKLVISSKLLSLAKVVHDRT